MYCDNCGRELPEDAKFCPSCGHAVEQQQEPSAAQPVAPAGQPPKPAAPAEPVAPAEPAQPPPAPEVTAAPSPPSATTPPTPQPTPSVPSAAAQGAPPPTQPPTPPSAAQPPPPQAAPPGGQAPPPQYAPPPPTQPPAPGAAPPAEAPKKGGGKCWLIGCIILLVLLIIGAVVGWISCKCAVNAAGNAVQNIEATTNGLDIWEPGEGAPTNVGDIVGRLGEAVEGLGQMAAGADITGFNPSDVEPAMLGPFYGFMGALAADDPNAMYQFMSPSLKESWSPDDWTVSTGWKHVSYELVDMDKSEDAVDFEITEVIHNEDSGEQQTLTWVVKMVKSGGTWAVDDFGQP